MAVHGMRRLHKHLTQKTQKHRVAPATFADVVKTYGITTKQLSTLKRQIHIIETAPPTKKGVPVKDLIHHALAKG